jgi:hypothetical protein
VEEGKTDHPIQNVSSRQRVLHRKHNNLDLNIETLTTRMLASGSGRPAACGSSSSSSATVALRRCALGRRGLLPLSRQRSLAVCAALQARGREIAAEQLTPRRVLGEGSYGQVFEVRD